MYKVAMLADHPDLHSGFAVVTRQFAQGMHDAGLDVHVYGFNKNGPQDKAYDYSVSCTPQLDPLARDTFPNFIRAVKPDVVVIVIDPGNVLHFAFRMLDKPQFFSHKRNGKDFVPPIVSYTPIEGKPVPAQHGDALYIVRANGGIPVVYHDWAKEAVEERFKDINPEVCLHGLDHASFRRYPDEVRHKLQKLVGFDKRFVVGSVGVNKRTKGHPDIIYTARKLKDMGHDDILFYIHCNPGKPTMMGYNLLDLVQYYDVQDMVIFRPVHNELDLWRGVDRESEDIESKIMDLEVPKSPADRMQVFASLDFISMMNTFDAYLDLSQAEGWCLPTGEAMACGVPTMMIDDNGIRRAIYGDGVDLIPALPEDYWDTWHSGSRLVKADPETVAHTILSLKKSEKLQKHLSVVAQEVAGRYKWQPEAEKFAEIVKFACQQSGGAVALTQARSEWDRAIFRSITINNEYRLPSEFPQDSIVVDIGAHIGGFVTAAVSRGAKVFAYEAHPENFEHLTGNTLQFDGQVSAFNNAVWRSDAEYPHKVFINRDFPTDEMYGANTGGNAIREYVDGDMLEVEAISIDDVIEAALIESKSGQVEMLKLDCEGSEWPILYTCSMLNRIKAIHGEYHEFASEHTDELPFFEIDKPCTIEALTEHLEQYGFQVKSFRHGNSSMGMFFARRVN